MKSKMIVAEYDHTPMSFRDDGWFNATRAAEKYGKRVADWMENRETQAYIETLSDVLKVPNSALLEARRGRYGGTWMHPKLAVRFAQWLDVRFAVWCDLQIDALLRGNHPHFDWQRLRHEATSSFKVMNAVLVLQRQMQGKVISPHCFSNEARLVNWALSGAFAGLDREALSAEELDLLAKLEERNAVLLGCGLNYAERKQALHRFATDWRTPEIAAA